MVVGTSGVNRTPDDGCEEGDRRKDNESNRDQEIELGIHGLTVTAGIKLGGLFSNFKCGLGELTIRRK